MRTRRLTQSFACLVPLALTFAAIAAPPPASPQVFPVQFSPNGAPPIAGAPVGFSYAGNKFVGSILDDGTGIKKLYSTDLTGVYQGIFAPAAILTDTSTHEHYVSSSLGLGGFPLHDIYVASANNIEHISNTGTDLGPVLGSLGGISGNVRGITFDNTGNYGYNMIVTTDTGGVYAINNIGQPLLLANNGEDTEGLDFAPTGAGAKWGTYNGYLFVASEGGSGTIRVVLPTLTPNNTPGITIATGVGSAEQLDFVPLNLGTGGPLEGMYSANYPNNVLKSLPSNFLSPIDMRGDIIVTGETNSNIYDVTAPFTFSVVGQFPNQPEDGLFLSADLINAPEPASLALLAGGSLLLLTRRKRGSSQNRSPR